MGERAFDDPELEEQRQQALRQVRQLGDPVLRTPAARIEVFDDALRDEATAMMDLMHRARGVGLAAPQIGRLRRLIVIAPFEDEPPVALVNPEITWFSDAVDSLDEGCLSIGEISVPVVRPVEIRVHAQDIAGEPVALEMEGFGARVVQHEVDHLNGILILDRTTPEERKEALRQLRAGPE
jgi:peptide deformylase